MVVQNLLIIIFPAIIGSQNSVYIIGGVTSKNKEVNIVDKFRIKTKTWHRLKSLNYARRDHGAAILRNKIYVMGGSCEDSIRKKLYFNLET